MKAQEPHSSSSEVTLWVFLSLIKLGFVTWKLQSRIEPTGSLEKINLRIHNAMKCSPSLSTSFPPKAKAEMMSFPDSKEVILIHIFNAFPSWT